MKSLKLPRSELVDCNEIGEQGDLTGTLKEAEGKEEEMKEETLSTAFVYLIRSNRCSASGIHHYLTERHPHARAHAVSHTATPSSGASGNYTSRISAGN
ncbi:hypothetical protein J6590_097520 [Homalodisca vitripennis]|nr:hypothetical protein J6590_097520 [Homalodisca vitripennis]